MSYGIICENESGFIQIDGIYDNMAVFASGTVSSSYGNTQNTVDLPANTPASYVIFAKAVTESGVTGLTFKYVASTNKFFFQQAVNDSTLKSISWIIAVRSVDMPVNNNPDHGLLVNKVNGDPAFNSNNGNFRVQQVSFEFITSTSTASTMNVPSMSGVYALMTGKTDLGIGQINSQLSAVFSYFVVWDYGNNTIKHQLAPSFIIGTPTSSLFGGGFKTNLIGTFT